MQMNTVDSLKNTIIQGDVLEVLKILPDNFINTIITSPPYYGLRDYGTAKWNGGSLECDHKGKPMVTRAGFNERYFGKPSIVDKQGECLEFYKDVCAKCGAVRIDKQIGLELTPDKYVSNLVSVFREAKRILKNDGTLWLNIGDSYAGNMSRASDGGRAGFGNPREGVFNRGGNGIKPKDLIGIPWMLAFALRNDGSASPKHMDDISRIINAITESYDSRDQWPDKIAVEVERLEREYVDANKGGWYLRQDIIWAKTNPMPESIKDRCTKSHEYLFLLSKSSKYYYDYQSVLEPASGYDGRRDTKFKGSIKNYDGVMPGGKPQSFAQNGHERWQYKNLLPDGQKPNSMHENRLNGKEYMSPVRNKRDVWFISTKPYKEAHFAVYPEKLIETPVIAGCPEGGLVLDPFFGSGTTGVVAKKLKRNYLGIELNPEYIEIAKNRIAKIT